MAKKNYAAICNSIIAVCGGELISPALVTV